MEKWLQPERNIFTQVFSNPVIENTYREIRESKAFLLYPIILDIIVCVITVFRHTQLYIGSLDNSPISSTPKYELINLILSIVIAILEFLSIFVKPFQIFRCTFLIVFVFYQTGSSPSMYYIDEIPSEPTYGFRYYSI